MTEIAHRGAAAIVARALRASRTLPTFKHSWTYSRCQIRCKSQMLSVAELKVPDYAEVKVVEGFGNALGELPELNLDGRSPGAGVDNPWQDLPLDQAVPLEGVITPPGPPRMRCSQLDNGVRIVSIDKHALVTSLGLFVHAGSRFETAETLGLSHFIELMAFKSTGHLNQVSTLKTVEQLGAAVSCRVGREDILYMAEVLREYVPIVLPLMIGNVLMPVLDPYEVEAAHQQVAQSRMMLEQNLDGLLAEHLHAAAYKGNTLGNWLYASDENVARFTPQAVRKYMLQHFSPERMILVGVNADHDELCKWAARAFAEGERIPFQSRTEDSPEYTGGEVRIAAANPLCHFMVGWESKGWNDRDLAALTVLQMLLGGGGSFSTGGPGKGMHTRLFTEVLNRYHWVESCQANSMMYTDSGIFSIYGTVLPQHSGDFVTVITRIIKSLATFSKIEVQRAKNALKSGIYMNLETKSVMMEDVGRQLVMGGKVGTASDFAKMIDAVSAEDLTAAAARCLSSKLTLVAYGDLSTAPSYAQVEAAIAGPIQSIKNAVKKNSSS